MTRKVGLLGFTACTVLLCLLMSSNSVHAAEIVGWGSRKTPNAPLNKLRVLAGGGLHSLALKTDGSLVGWGCDCYGEATPPSGNDYVAITAGYRHSLALKADGSIVGWGRNTSGQATPPVGNDYIAIAAGSSHNLGLKADGSIVGWGRNTSGQATPPVGNDYIAIAAGYYHSLGLKSDGSIVGWGDNEYGQATPPTGNDYIAITGGGSHSLALKADGSIVGWGRNDYGQATPPVGNDYIAIAAGSDHSLALKADGSIVGWGWNDYGQATPPSGNDFIAIAAGTYHSLALKADSTIVGWGGNEYGQTTSPTGNDYIAITAGNEHDLGLRGNGSIVGWGNQTTPPAGNDYIAITAGSGYSLALKADGSIIGWGYNKYGQAAPPAGNDYIAIAAGYYHSLGLKSDGSIVGWGDNEYGQATPPAGGDYVAIAAGYRYSLALKADGSIVGWGDNEYGKATPPPGNNFIAIAAGSSHNLGLKADGSIVGWGRNTSGQATPPVGNDYIAIAAGSSHNLGLKADGSIVGWGLNSFGQAEPPTGNDYTAIAAGNCRSMALRSGFIIPAQQVVFPSEWTVPVLSRPFTLHNHTDESVEWTLTVPENYPFLEPEMDSGILDPDQSETVSVLVHADTLPGGISRCRLLLHFTIDDEPQVTPVTLTIVGPRIELSPTQLDFRTEVSGELPESQSFTIRNTGGGMLHWSINEAALPDWLSVDNSSGALIYGQTDEVLIEIDHTTLSMGYYTFDLDIISQNAENSPQAVRVTLLVRTTDTTKTIHVPSSYIPTIQAAVDVAMSGNLILVADGVYTGQGNRDIDILGKSLVICSENGPEHCIIDCNELGRGFFIHADGDDTPSVTLQGLTIRNGLAQEPAKGGGIYCTGTNLTLSNCIVADCKASGTGDEISYIDTYIDACGGGICIESCPQVDLLKCRITGNRADGYDAGGYNILISSSMPDGGDALGGGIYASNSSIHAVSCWIEKNRIEGGRAGILSDPSEPDYFCAGAGFAGGGGIFLVNSTADIFASEIRRCSAIGAEATIPSCINTEGPCGGGGIYLDESICILTDSILNQNVANSICRWVSYGGGLCGGTGQLLNCRIEGNASGYGGGITSFEGVLANCTVIGNRAGRNGSGLNECAGLITNCIIVDNEPSDTQIRTCSEPTYCCFSGADGSNGNIDADPLFVNPGYWYHNDDPNDPEEDYWVSGDYHLKSEYGRWNPIAQQWVYDDVTSPCIDAGDPADPGWQNELWPHGGRINMGAYGGTPQAGMSPDPMGNIADLDHDDTVGIGDLSLFADDWLQWQILLDTDLDRNNHVNLFDLAILAENWLRS